MRVCMQKIYICQYQLRVLSRNYKIYVVPVCMFVFLANALKPFHTFMTYVNESASPYLFPFLFYDLFLNALIFSCVLLFFVDAPFYTKDQLFVITRIDVSEWTLGQMLYIVCVSFLYMLFIFISSVVLMIPNIEVSGEWGRIWTTLAVTDAGSQFGIAFGVPSVVVFHYTPCEAVFLAFALAVLICVFYGLLVWFLNLYLGKLIGMVLSLSSILLVTRIRFLPSWIMYLVPVSWMDISTLSGYTNPGITIEKSLLILFSGILILAILVYHKMQHVDIGK